MTDFLLEGMLYEHTPLLFLSFLFFLKTWNLCCVQKKLLLSSALESNIFCSNLCHLYYSSISNAVGMLHKT